MIWGRPILLVDSPNHMYITLDKHGNCTTYPSLTDLFPKEMDLFERFDKVQFQWGWNHLLYVFGVRYEKVRLYLGTSWQEEREKKPTTNELFIVQLNLPEM